MTAVPWQETAAFRQACLFFGTIDSARPLCFVRVREMAAQIMALLNRLDRELEGMCRLTCPDCKDNCCARATIWYDFRDLLFLYFSGQPLPDRQIEKREIRSEKFCVHLTAAGCDLPRCKRPFVCTWYICPAQKTFSPRVQEDIRQIKSLRREMEDLFCRNCL